ncbi:MAG: Xaa-Pro dipeptidyl-peptidase [Rhodothermales bacterium]|nr:Xaa-Pro dipeptidyl-peptidase [Rhodothermales bacterium]MBO6779319.1 Xaa-Pro dipeptidyl-peptidase [Rhodothermales bacterium]
MMPFKPLAALCLILLLATSACAQDLTDPEFLSARPVFDDGQAQVVDAFADSDTWIREQLWVETEFDSDGDGTLDRVHVSVVRQAQTDLSDLRVPVIYGSSPYYSGTSNDYDNFWDVRHELGAEPPARTPLRTPQLRTRDGISNGYVEDWLPRGFAVVHSESPGTGLSQGCPTVGGLNESLAPKAVIDWLNGRAKGFTAPVGGDEVVADWTTGKVGMTGTSYNGTLPLAAATTGVAGLEAIIPVAPNTSYYHYYRSNGLVRHPGGYLGEDIDVLYDFIHSRDSDRREYCDATIRDGLYAENQDRVTGDYNDFWAGRDYLNVIDNVRAATLMAHAFNDWNVMPEHSVRIVEALKERGVPVQQYYHQGGHGGPPPMAMMNRWFTRYLYDVQNGVEQDPKAWIVRQGNDRLEPTPYEDYPNPEASPVSLYPNAGGQSIGTLTLTAPGAQGVESLIDNVSFDGQALARAEWTEHRLLYVTPELSQDAHISGTASITVKVAADKPAANLSIWLVSLPWTEGGRAKGGIITRGWADPQNTSLRESSPLVPGEYRELTFDLQPDDQVIPAGQQIGLMIMSSDRDYTLWPEPGTSLSVDLDATSLSLPVVGGMLSFKNPEGTN